MRVNLKWWEGKDMMKKVVKESEVIMENFKRGRMEGVGVC